MTGKQLGIVLEHSIELVMPFDRFQHCVENFKDPRFVFQVNSDGKFRAELKKDQEDEEYILRISGWLKKNNLEIRRIYVREDRTLDLESHVFDFLDLLESWALEYKGNFYFVYIDFEEPMLDACWIVKGEEKEKTFEGKEIRDVLEEYGYNDPNFL